MSRNIRTFNDLNGDNDRDSDHDSEGEDAGPPRANRRQDFYVGSGQQVLGPPGSGRTSDDVFGRVMASAKAHGADSLTPEELAKQLTAEGTTNPNLVRVVMTMWQNGFSIDDGPLKALDDPANEAFLKQIMTGRVPAEIAQLYPGKEIDFQLERKSTEYVKPKPKPFSGTGARLGNVVPTVVGEGSSSSSAPEAAATSSSENEKNLEDAKNELKVDSTQPTTNIQIRLPSNQRIVVTLNQTHTVSAVRSFLVTARPELAFGPFQLMTTYPNKVIDDETVTLKDANLLGSALAIKVQSE